jgi:hypothetical protein
MTSKVVILDIDETMVRCANIMDVLLSKDMGFLTIDVP